MTTDFTVESDEKFDSASLINALSEIRAGTTFVTPNQYREFLNVREVSARRRFFDQEGIQLFAGSNAKSISESSTFQHTFGIVAAQQGRGDAALAAFADATRFEAVTMERRLFNFVTQTMRNSTVPIRRIKR